MTTIRDSILAAPDLTTEPVEIPEWNTTLLVKSMTGADRDQLEARYSDTGGVVGLKALIVVLSVVDENGERVFSLSDVEALQEKSASAIDRVFHVAQRLSHLLERDMQELAGN